ncbi:MAG: antitoxin family protein [Candidatus Methanospirareceae archaeon]
MTVGEIEVVYEGGVFKPLKEVKLKEGAKAVVFVRPTGIVRIAREYRMKVNEDVLHEFLSERR